MPPAKEQANINKSTVKIPTCEAKEWEQMHAVGALLE